MTLQHYDIMAICNVLVRLSVRLFLPQSESESYRNHRQRPLAILCATAANVLVYLRH